MRWHRKKKGKRPIPAKGGLLFRRTNGECTSPGVRLSAWVQELWDLWDRRENFGEQVLSVDTFFTVSRPNDANRYSHYGVGFFCQAGALTVMLNP